jgi:menaquinone-specific isochorismate synthase
MTPGASIHSAQRLLTRSAPLDGERIDLLDHLGADGFAWFDGEHGFVTSGVALAVDPADAPAVVREIADERAPGTPAAAGARAVGALPFDGDGRLVVPTRIVGIDRDGRAWETMVAGAHPSSLQVTPAHPARFVVEDAMTRDAWDAAVAEVLELVAAGALRKAVLARAVTIDADQPFDVPAVLRSLRQDQPGCVVYADGGFVGASPEILVRRTGPTVTARPLAGTADSAARLLASSKDAHEHQLVVDAVVDALRAACDDVRSVGPSPVTFADVTHFATTVTGRVRDGSASVLDLVHALHPTPAVGGTPRDAAVAAIRRLEPTPRGLYAGPCGWVDRSGDGEFVVALRCAQLDGARALLHAGAGIVAGSDTAAEWAETRAKLDPMLRALVRP